MDEQQIKTAFSEGISLSEGQFTPIYYLSRVDEPEFGCEGRPEQGKMKHRQEHQKGLSLLCYGLRMQYNLPFSMEEI